MKLSAVVSTYNNENMIDKCLSSLSFADEIIVIDHYSADKTAALAKKYTKNVFLKHNDPNHIDLQKNYGFEKAKGEWILSIDSDEMVPKELADEIMQVLTSPSDTAYRIPRKNIIFGKWIRHSIWWPDYQVRLFKKEKGKYEEEKVHTQLKVEGTIGELRQALLHQNYQSVTQYLSKMDTYTESEAEALYKSNSHFIWVDTIRMPVHDFLKTFFLQKGYLDGFHGLVLSTLQSFYTFLVLIKLWEKRGFQEEENKNFLRTLGVEWQQLQKETMYWLLSAYSENANPMRKALYIIRRKLLSSRFHR